MQTEIDHQLERFAEMRRRFADQVNAVSAFDEPAFVRRDWVERNAGLRASLLPVPPDDFLRHHAILYQMFVARRHLLDEMPYVLGRLPAVELAREDPVGDPPRVDLTPHGVETSSNTVHHLYHLLRFEEFTGRRLAEFETVVEWGGGYGNLAKLLLRLHGGSPTCVLIDTPVFAALQWLYLGSVLGEEAVVLHAHRGAAVVAGKVNLVPVGLVRDLDVRADLFISTWALNECTPDAQQHVIDRDWFGADALLLAMHRGDPLEPAALAAGATPVPLGEFMPGQHYFIRASRSA